MVNRVLQLETFRLYEYHVYEHELFQSLMGLVYLRLLRINIPLTYILS